jgi:membrane dipeptidase
MNYIDFHCDTASAMLEQKEPLLKNNLKIDIERLEKGDALAQFFALYIDKESHKSSYDYCVDMLANFYQELALNLDRISLCRNYDELMIAQNHGKVGAFLTIEEGDALEGDLDKLIFFKERGVSLITLTWNYENDLGYSNYEWRDQNRGLKPKGIEVVEAMNAFGMLIDVSHLSDAGFYDVLKYSKEPFIASHSNSRVMTNHPRNLSDAMLKKLADAGGITGINFFNNFLVNGELSYKLEVSTIANMVRHIKHIRAVAGVEVIGLGSDFDGIPNPVEIEDASAMYKLSDALLAEGFSYDEVEKIFYKNALRLIKDVLR